MIIKSKLCKGYDVPIFYLNETPIDVVVNHNYLGVIISDNRKDDLDIKRQIRSIYARGNTILKYFRHCTHEVKCTLFKTYCTNLYCSHL